MRTRLSTTLAAAAIIVSALAASSSSAAAATPSGTTVTASASQVAGFVFVAGDVGRLSQIPSGTEDVVLERVLQQLYTANPTLDPAQAVSDIQSLQQALSSGPQALSAGTLTVMAGNQRILAILRVLSDSSAPPDVAHAVAQTNDLALQEASQSMQAFGQAFDASADTLSTVAYMSFSPARVLADTVALAARDKGFGQARDMLWQPASHESVFDDTQALLAENPALQTDAVKGFVALLAPDGTLSTTVGQLESLVRDGITQIGDQNCPLASGSNGASPSDCTSGALHDAQLVAQACPAGVSTTDAACMSARGQAASDAGGEVATIASQQAATAAESVALGNADQELAWSEIAEAQAASQIADDENQYLTWQSTQQVEKTYFDIGTLLVTLSVSEIDPAFAASALFSVIGDTVGLGFSGPDPNTIILQGLQNVSQQLSDFETYTQNAFHVLDVQLSNLSTQIAQAAYQLSAQLTQVQQQITQLTSKLTTLQTSVDHLQSEVQTLFAQGARNDLSTLINQYIGYRQANGVALPQSQFATAAGALYQDATSTAISQTVLTPPTGFDALSASSLVSSSDTLSLDSNINYFNLFGAKVVDAPGVTWPGALTTTCAPNADPANAICLPDPDFWATSARAFAQLLTENPAYVTPTRLQQLSAIMAEGQVIANAIHTLSVNDAGSDAGGTGNRTLDAALSYYKLWGARIGDPVPGLPNLVQALLNKEQDYLNSQIVPGLSLNYGAIAPFRGATQSPDLTGLLTTNSFTNVPLCQSALNPTQVGRLNPSNYLLPHLTSSIIGFLPVQVLNAVRLGLGRVFTCWTAIFGYPQTAQGGPLNLTFQFTYVSKDGSVIDQVGSIAANTTGVFCNGADGGNRFTDAIFSVYGGWPGVGLSGCSDYSGAAGQAQFQTPSYPADVQNSVEPAIANALAAVQRGVYEDILSNGSTLTSGTDDANNVLAAAQRLGGANAILNGYISLGLPQALASDDTLHGLVSGANSDAFAPADPNFNPWGVQPAATVPDQLVNYYKAALAAMPSFDPAYFAGDLVRLRADRLEAAIRPHIIVAPAVNAARVASPRVKGIAATATTDVLAETNPLIGPTLDRLDETRTALADTLANGATLYVSLAGTGTGSVSEANISCPGTCSHAYAPGTSVTLTATPASGSSFTGWTGACTGTGTCRLLLNYDQSATATFARGPGSPAGTTAPATTATTTSAPPPPGGHAHGTPTARCTLKPTGNTVLLAKRRGGNRNHGRNRSQRVGALTVTVNCDRGATIRLTGRLTQLVGRRHKPRATTVLLGPVRTSVKARVAKPLTVTIPVGALQALARHARESVTFLLSAADANGTSTATASIRVLVAIR